MEKAKILGGENGDFGIFFFSFFFFQFRIDYLYEFLYGFDEYGCAVDEFVDIGRGQSSNCTVRTFSLHSFPLDLGGK